MRMVAKNWSQVVGEKDLDASAQWGTARAILVNMITGVTEGFKNS